MLGVPIPVSSRMEVGLGVLVLIVGATVMSGWVFGVEILKGGQQNGAGMKANTALAFLLCGTAILGSAGTPSLLARRVVTILASAVALLAGLTIVEELLQVDFHIDQMLFEETADAFAIIRPGRMSPAAAYCFIAMAAAFSLSVMPARFRLRLPLAAALSASVLVIGGLFFAAYVSNRALGSRWGATTIMAAFTSLTFTVLGLAGLLRSRRLRPAGWTLSPVGTAGFVLGLVTMLGAAELATAFARDMEAAAMRVVDTQQALQVLQQIRTALRELESDQRAHLLLGDESIVATRERDKGAVRQRLAALAGASDGAVQQAMIESLRQAVEARLAFGDSLVETRRAHGFDVAQALFADRENLALSQTVTDRIAPLVQREEELLLAHRVHLKTVTATTFLLLPIGSFLGLTALLAGLFFLDDGLERRARAEAAMERSGAQLQVAFDNMSEGVRVIDDVGTIVQMNPAGATMHGLIDPAPTMQTVAAQVDAIAADGRSLRIDEWVAARAVRGEFVRNEQIRFQRRNDGRFVVAELSTAPLPTEPGQPRRVIVTSHDMTERIAAHEAIRAGRLRLERVVDNLTAAVIIHGLDGDEVHWNRAALTLFGMAAPVVAGKTARDFEHVFELSTLDGEVVPFDRWPMSRLMLGDALEQVELQARRVGSGWQRTLAFEGASVRDAAGEALVFLTISDITARKEAEAELHHVNARLEERVAQRTHELDAKTRELESFCYSVSHDLKAPLRGIDGYSRLLMDEYADRLDADGQAFIANVRTATTQMNMLIDDLLTYSQQERRTLAPSRIPLRSFVGEQLARRHAEMAHAALTVDVEDVVVRADRVSLAMALRNLIDNAVKFSQRSTPPEISIVARVAAGRCVLSVQDNGTGFDMRHHDKMFEIFQRLHRAEDYPGTGVGLALVRKAMDRMGGRVWAEGSLGGGATFHLDLELADASVEVVA